MFNKNEKSILRCACCDTKFDSSTMCREHFESDQHKIVAIVTWIQCIAKKEILRYGGDEDESIQK